MGILYIVSTPIGNLEDISKRALRILSEVDLILCEDTRVTQTLLNHYEIKTPTLSYHQHSKIAKVEEIKKLLEAGKNLALVSDAGTPGISDPGNQLVAQMPETKAMPVPGPSALMALASVSGFPMDRFVFLGFPPVKNKRKKFFSEAIAFEIPVVFYESTYRIIKTLQELSALDGEREVVVGRELTKQFETIYRGRVAEVLETLKNGETRGEFTVILRGK
jgi:16S rRNA (cytidine1402-2'-O)-methyltransferase